MFPLDDSHLTEDQREQLAIHRADCLAVLGREFCGYECMKCGLCSKWSHGRHKARMCRCNWRAPANGVYLAPDGSTHTLKKGAPFPPRKDLL